MLIAQQNVTALQKPTNKKITTVVGVILRMILNLVELLGCYLDSPHSLETLSTLLNLPDAQNREPRSTIRQHQMRLSKVHQTQSVEAYSAGQTVYELTVQFAVTAKLRLRFLDGTGSM